MLHLIEPLGFSLSQRNLKRAGMDYWDRLEVHRYADFNDFLEKNPEAVSCIFMATTKGRRVYSDVHYTPGCYIMFGKESAGIPEDILMKYYSDEISGKLYPHSDARYDPLSQSE